MQKTRRSCTTKTVLHAAVLAALSVPTTMTSAATYQKASTIAELTTFTAWTTSTVPTSSDVADFESTSLGGALTLGSAANWGELYDNGATGSINLSGSTLTLTGGLSAGGTANSGLYITSNATTSNGLTLTASNNIVLGSNQAWTVVSGKTAQFSGMISNAGGGVYGITEAGAGVLELYGANTFSGGVTLNATGQIDITQPTSLGTGVFNFNSTNNGGGLYARTNYALAVANDIALSTTAGKYILLKSSNGVTTGTQLTLSGNISGGGANVIFELNATTALDNSTSYLLSGSNNFTTGTTLLINLGNLVVGSTGALNGASVTLQSPTNSTAGNLQFNVNGAFNSAIAISSTGGDAFSTGASSITLGGVISGNALTQIGTGTIILTATNTYSGATNVNGGTLQIGNGGTTGSIASTTAIAVNSGAALTINRGDNVSQGAVPGSTAVIPAAALTGSGAFTQAGSGITTLTAANTYSGGTTITAGILQANTAGRVLNSDNSLKSSATGTGPVTIAANGVLAGNGGTGDVTVNSGGTITAGTGPSPSDTVATLQTGIETWNNGGVYAAKVGTAGNGADTSDELVMSGLSPASPTGFTIQITGLNGLNPVSGHSFIIAEVSNATYSSLATSLSQIAITYAGSAVGQTFNLSPSSQADPNGGYDIVANDITPSPEPTSALLFGLAAAPLLMLRRRAKVNDFSLAQGTCGS